MLLRLLTPTVLVTVALALSACGDDDTSTSGGEAPAAAAPAGGGGGEMSCEDVMVPGHLAAMVTATGTECGVAEAVAAKAEGMGRAAYEEQGFMCEPSDASDGDTNYACTMGDAEIAFLYGTT